MSWISEILNKKCLAPHRPSSVPILKALDRAAGPVQRFRGLRAFISPAGNHPPPPHSCTSFEDLGGGVYYFLFHMYLQVFLLLSIFELIVLSNLYKYIWHIYVPSNREAQFLITIIDVTAVESFLVNFCQTAKQFYTKFVFHIGIMV